MGNIYYSIATIQSKSQHTPVKGIFPISFYFLSILIPSLSSSKLTWSMVIGIKDNTDIFGFEVEKCNLVAAYPDEVYGKVSYWKVKECWSD